MRKVSAVGKDHSAGLWGSLVLWTVDRGSGSHRLSRKVHVLIPRGDRNTGPPPSAYTLEAACPVVLESERKCHQGVSCEFWRRPSSGHPDSVVVGFSLYVGLSVDLRSRCHEETVVPYQGPPRRPCLSHLKDCLQLWSRSQGLAPRIFGENTIQAMTTLVGRPSQWTRRSN